MYPSLEHPGKLLGRDKILKDVEKLVWEARMGEEFQAERDQIEHAAGVFQEDLQTG